MPSSTLPGLPTALLAAANAGTDLVYVTVSPFGVTDDRKQDRTNFFAQIPVPVGIGNAATTGLLNFYNSNNANIVTITTDTPASGLTYVLPNADPTAGQVLTASAPVANVVTLTWVTNAAGPGGSNTQVQYNNTGAFGGITGITSDGTNLTAGSGNLRATSPRITTNILDANGLQVIGLTATATAVNSINIANNTTTNPVTITTVGDANTGLTITCAGTGVTTITGNAILNAGTGATTIGEASLGAEQLRVTSVSASRVALSVNSLANTTVDLVQLTATVDDTATVANLITVNCNSNGAAAAGFGQSITYTLESSTTASQTAAIEEIFWKVATHASRGSVYAQSTVDNAVTGRRVIIAPRLALTDNVATTVFSFTIATDTGAGGIIHATIFAANNGGAVNVWSGDVAYCAGSDGTVFRNASVLGTPAAAGSGTMNVTWAAVNTGNVISIQVTADTVGYTPSAGQFFIVFSIEQNHGPVITLA